MPTVSFEVPARWSQLCRWWSYAHTRRRALLSAASVLAVVVILADPAAPQDAGSANRPEVSAVQPRPLDLVKTCVARFLAIVRSQPAGTPPTTRQRAEIRRVADDLFDFDEMARRTLAQHWKERTPQEQAEFVRLFIDALEQSYLTTIVNYPVTGVTFQGETIDGSYAQVRSRIISERHDIPMEYRLMLSRAHWQVYDVVADGVSLISSYRSQFNTVIRVSSFGQLLEKLRTREVRARP